MSNISNQTMGQTPSRLGMPMCGSAFGAGRATTFGTTGAYVARDRHVAALVKGAFPGTSAWRPPTC
jgi:hypothetical protein